MESLQLTSIPQADCDDCWQVGDLVVDARRGRVARGGEVIALPQLSLDLLIALVRAAPAVVSVESLMETVWPRLVVGPETVSQRVKLLRAALHDDPRAPRYIAGVRGRGYRLVAPVSIPGNAAAAPHGGVCRSRAGIRALLTLAVAVLAAAALLAALWFTSSDTPDPRQPIPRIAVLPFVNLSPDPADAFFTDGLHDEIIGTLAQLPDLEVISRTTMRSLSSRPAQPMTEIASELRATHVLEGTVRREADRVRLSVRLVDAGSDTPAWSTTLNGRLVEALDLQTAVAAEVGARVTSRLDATRALPPRPTANAAAYDDFLKARLRRTELPSGGLIGGPAEYVEIEALLTRALLRDPGFVLAYVERARLRGALVYYNYDSSAERIRQVREDIDAAARLAPGEPRVLAVEAFYQGFLDREWRTALETFERAEAAGSLEPVLLADKANMYYQLGRAEDAVRAMERAAELDPANPFIMAVLSDAYALAGRPVDVIRTQERLRARNPGDPSIAYFIAAVRASFAGEFDELHALAEQARAQLAGADPELRGRLMMVQVASLNASGRHRELARLLQSQTDEQTRLGSGFLAGRGPTPWSRTLGWQRLFAGDREAAREAGRQLAAWVEIQPETKLNRWYFRMLGAEAQLFLGDHGRAVALAREARAMVPRDGHWIQWVETSAALAAIHAWRGAPDDAVPILEILADARPGLLPAEIARDPRFVRPLARSARYGVLRERLEADMRRNAYLIAEAVSDFQRYPHLP